MDCRECGLSWWCFREVGRGKELELEQEIETLCLTQHMSCGSNHMFGLKGSYEWITLGWSTWVKLVDNLEYSIKTGPKPLWQRAQKWSRCHQVVRKKVHKKICLLLLQKLHLQWTIYPYCNNFLKLIRWG